ncbi:MAG: hypothetical protein ACE1ZP_07935, partial [Myxococcota bacterium]
MAAGAIRVGAVRERAGAGGKRFYLDFGRRAPRLFSFQGVRFQSRGMADGLLRGIELEVAKGRPLDEVLAEFRREDSAAHGIEPLLGNWLALFEKKVKAGDRAPRTMRDYRRWVGPSPEDRAKRPDHFRWWRGKTIFEITTANLEEW